MPESYRIGMKIGQIVHILAILLLIGVFVQPVPAAGNQTSDSATNFYNIGVNLLESKEYERAIVAFDQALASNTTMIRQSDALLYIYQDKGYALIQLNNYSAAIQTLDQGLVIYQNDEKLWYNKGYALFKLGQYQEALNAYDKVLLINNASLPALNNRGDTLFQLGRYQEAVDSYSRANTIDPNDTYSIAGLAKARSAAGAANQTTMVIGIIILVIAVGGVIWFIMFRKPAEKKQDEKIPQGKKTADKKSGEKKNTKGKKN
jgi:tetratricopeptide (TPR) repeat protein